MYILIFSSRHILTRYILYIAELAIIFLLKPIEILKFIIFIVADSKSFILLKNSGSVVQNIYTVDEKSPQNHVFIDCKRTTRPNKMKFYYNVVWDTRKKFDYKCLIWYLITIAFNYPLQPYRHAIY